MNPDININYILRYINRGAAQAASRAHDTIRRSVDDSTSSIRKNEEANDRAAEASKRASNAARDAASATSEHARTSSRATREVDKNTNALTRLHGALDRSDRSLASTNSRFMFLRNVVGLIKWPALITGAGLAAQAVGGLGGAVVALTAALAPLSGALVAYPAVIGSFVQALGVAKLGLFGVGDAIKGMVDQQVGAGAAATQMADQTRAAASQVRAAEEAVADAKRASRFAEEDLREAREEATRQLVDMRLAAEGAALGEQRAAVALREAKRALAEGLDMGVDQLEERDLRLGVKEAELALKDSRIQANRATKDLVESEREGVRGSEAMVQARRAVADAARAEQDALRQLSEANRSLREAQNGAGAAADNLAEQMAQMSPAARDFAKFLFSLKPRLDELRATAARGLLPGVERGITAAMRNFPVLNRIIDVTARRMGNLAERTGRYFGRRGVGQDMERIGRSNARLMTSLGNAGLHLGDSFRHILVAARPFTRWLGDSIESWAKLRAEQAKTNRENGTTERFFERTRKVMERVWGIATELGGAFKEIGRAARPLGNEVLRSLERNAREFRKWTESAEGRNELRDYFRDIRPAVFELGRLIADISKAFIQLSRQRGFVVMSREIRRSLLPALVDVIGKTTEAFGPHLIRALGHVARLIGNLAGHTGPLNIFVDTLGLMARGLNAIFESSPLLRQFVTTLLSLVAVSKALRFAAAITGIKTMVGWLARLLPATRAQTVATQQLAAANRMAAMSSMHPGQMMLPGMGGPLAPTTVRGAYGASRAAGAGRLASAGAALKAAPMAALRFAGPIGLGIAGFGGLMSAMQGGRGIGIGDRISNFASGATFGLIPREKSLDEIREEGTASAQERLKEQLADGAKLNDIKQQSADLSKKINEIETADLPGEMREEMLENLRAQQAVLEKQVGTMRERAQVRDIRKAEELMGGGPDSFNKLFDVIIKKSGDAEKAVAVTSRGMLSKLGGLRDEGSAKLGGLYLDMLKEQAKRHPELRDNVAKVARQMEAKWEKAGKDIRVISGEVVRNTPQLWDRMYDKLNNRTERWRQLHQQAFTSAQRRMKRLMMEFQGLSGPVAERAVRMMERAARAGYRLDSSMAAATAQQQAGGHHLTGPMPGDRPRGRRQLGGWVGMQMGGMVRRMQRGGGLGLDEDARSTDRFTRETHDKFDRMGKGVRRRMREMDEDTRKRMRGMREGSNRQSDEMRKRVGENAQEMRTTHARRLREMEVTTADRFGRMVGTTRSRGADMVASTRRSMGETDRAVYTGLNYIVTATSRALRAFDADPIKLTVPKPQSRQMGGPVMVPGTGEGDIVGASVRPGTFILNREASAALLGFQSGGAIPVRLEPGELAFPPEMAAQMGGMLERLNRDIPRFREGGRANRNAFRGGFDVMGAKPGFVPFMQYLNSMFGPIYVMSGIRPGSRIAGTGALSNHSTGNAVDISTRGIEGAASEASLNATGQLAQRMDALHAFMAKHIRLPGDFLWRTFTGGNHYNHIHRGITSAHADDPQLMMQYLSTLPRGGSFAPIRRPRVKGTDGPMKRLAQAAIDDVHKAGQSKMSRASARSSQLMGGAAMNVPTSGPLQAIAKRMVEAQWNAGQWPFFNDLVNRESGWNPRAVNPSSGAAGLAQALPPSKYPPGAWPYTGKQSAVKQLQWMVQYVQERYGNPAGAIAWHNSHNWYQRGGPVRGFQRGGAANPVRRAMRNLRQFGVGDEAWNRHLEKFNKTIEHMALDHTEQLEKRMRNQMQRLRRGKENARQRQAINRIGEALEELDDELAERAKKLTTLLEKQQARTSLSEGRFEEFELRQQLAGTYETGGTARAEFIQTNILPRLNAERSNIRKQLRIAEQRGNSALARELRQALQDTTNRILTAQLEAQELIKENTKEAAERLAEMGGQLSFEFGGQAFSDILNTGVGT